MTIQQHDLATRNSAASPIPAWMPPRLGDCIRKGCFVCIEHADAIKHRYTNWQLWGTPSCYNGDTQALDNEIETCKSAHADHYIRLNIEDFGSHSRMSLVVHHPAGVALNA